MFKHFTHYLLMPLALFIFISQSAFSAGLITNSKLKEWIKANTDQLPGVVVNADGGIDNTTANLEALAKINELDCSKAGLTTTDELIRHMSGLEQLDCSDNPLAGLDVSNNINLKRLYCWHNQLASLDLSNNKKLEELCCPENQLTNLNVSNITGITYLYCMENQLTSLSLNNTTALVCLMCSGNQISSLDVSKNIKLEDLYCDDNILSELDISSLSSLEGLNCCNQTTGFTLYLTKEQKNIFNEEDYCDAILKEKDGSICEIEWLDIYPNPTTGKFFIESKFLSDEIKILNLAGEVLYKNTLNAEKTEIDISNLPAGVYFVITKGKIGKVIKN